MSTTEKPQEIAGNTQVNIQVPEYLGRALSGMPFETVPSGQSSFWQIVQLEHPETKKPVFFAVQVSFTVNGIEIFWHDLDDLQKLVQQATVMLTMLTQATMASTPLLVADKGQMEQAIGNMKRSNMGLRPPGK